MFYAFYQNFIYTAKLLIFKSRYSFFAIMYNVRLALPGNSLRNLLLNKLHMWGILLLLCVAMSVVVMSATILVYHQQALEYAYVYNDEHAILTIY